MVLAIALLPTAPVHAQAGTSLADSLQAVTPLFDKQQAMDLVASIDPYYRMRGNQGYIRSLEACYRALRKGGFSTPGSGATTGDVVEFKDFGPVLPAWTPFSASLEIYSPDVGVLHSFETEAGAERTFLCGNSFPTPADGVIAPLVEYEHSKPVESYAGTIVYGSLPAESLFARAVQQGGALGVISSYLPQFNEPELQRDAIRYSTVPYDEQAKGFGLNVSPAKRDVLQRMLGEGKTTEEITEELYLRTLSRYPDAEERRTVLTAVERAGERRRGIEDAFWALLNSKEFLYNH